MPVVWKKGLTVVQDPDANLDYLINWADWLPVGDEIAEASIICDPTGPTISEPELVVNNTKALVWIDTRTAIVDQKYKITSHIKTLEDREDDRSFFLTVKEQ